MLTLKIVLKACLKVSKNFPIKDHYIVENLIHKLKTRDLIQYIVENQGPYP
jgi:hypothetical protein